MTHESDEDIMREALSTDWTNLRRTVDIRKEVDQSGEEESRRINPERERQRRFVSFLESHLAVT